MFTYDHRLRCLQATTKSWERSKGAGALVNSQCSVAVGVQEAKQIIVKLLEAGKAVCSSNWCIICFGRLGLVATSSKCSGRYDLMRVAPAALTSSSKAS